MEQTLRSRFNADFTSEKYAALLRCVNDTEKWPADFRISETPIFMTHKFTDEVVRASKEIIDLTRTSAFAKHAASAVPETWKCLTNRLIPIFSRWISRFAPRTI